MKHAVVIGGSMAGILTAAALGKHFDAVTVIERDRYPDGPEPRKGVPQARHLHAFWAGGLRAVEQMLPGAREDLRAAGGVPLDFPTDLQWLTPPGRWCTRFDASQHVVSASRPLIDWVIRRRVARNSRITFRTAHDVTGLRLDAAGDVTGLTVRSRDDGAESELAADLVVDASGRGSAMPEWLEAVGRTRPRESVVDAFLGYATRRFAIPADFAGDWKALYVQAAPPKYIRSGILFPVEDGQWVVTVMGGGRDYPPNDEDGFLEFARSLRSQVLYDAIRSAEALTPVVSYRRTGNRRRHYEELKDLPGRLIVAGDSMCAFNPVYGQGMTVAATQARTLDELLQRSGGLDRLDGLTRTAQRALARHADGAWMLATGEDLRYPTTEGAKVSAATRMTHRYLNRVLSAAAVNRPVNEAFLRVLNMIDPPQALFRPGVMARALAPGNKPVDGPLTAPATRAAAAVR